MTTVYGYEGKRSENGSSSNMSEVVKVAVSPDMFAYQSNTMKRGSVFSSWLDMIRNSFLPVGYPTSVQPEYMKYQIYDSLQALCSYLRGVLCVHAVLVGAGVGQDSGNALVAALAWVMKDGVGMLASIIFASSCSTFFAVYMKEWRLFADVINDVGQLLDMVSALVPSDFYLLVLSLSAICKAFCGVAAGATKLCITNHLARCNNAGDLITKEGTQETAVTLVGLILGMLSAQLISANANHAMFLFLFLTGVHVWANHQAVYILHMNSVNPSRCFLLVNEALPLYDAHASEVEMSVFNKTMASSDKFSIERINTLESLVNTCRALSWSHKIYIGCSLSSALTICPMVDDECRRILKEFSSRNLKYCLIPRRGSGSMSVLLKSSAQSVDILRAVTHCRKLQQDCNHVSEGGTGVISVEDILSSISAMELMWEPLHAKLKSEGWDLSDRGILFSCDEWVFGTEDKIENVSVNSATKKKQ